MDLVVKAGTRVACLRHQWTGCAPSSSAVEWVMIDSQTEKTLAGRQWRDGPVFTPLESAWSDKFPNSQL